MIIDTIHIGRYHGLTVIDAQTDLQALEGIAILIADSIGTDTEHARYDQYYCSRCNTSCRLADIRDGRCPYCWKLI
jgi:rubrerythrin